MATRASTIQFRNSNNLIVSKTQHRHRPTTAPLSLAVFETRHTRDLRKRDERFTDTDKERGLA